MGSRAAQRGGGRAEGAKGEMVMDVGCFGCSIRPCHITHSTQRTHSKRVYNSRRPPSFLHLTPSFSPLSLFTTHLTYSLHDFSTSLHTTTHSTQSLHDTTTSRRRNLSTADLAHQINQPFTQQKCSSPSLPPPPSWPSLVSSLSFLLVSLLVLSSTLAACRFDLLGESIE